MFKNIVGILLGLVLCILVSACGQSKPPEIPVVVAASAPETKVKVVPYETWSKNSAASRDNLTINANAYRSSSARLKGYNFIDRADSTIGSKCSVGHGWAEVIFTKADEEKKDATGNPVIHRISVWCSTFDKSRGCMLDDVFRKSNYTTEAQECQDGKLPDPLPRI